MVAQQCVRGMDHRTVGGVDRLAGAPALQVELRLERLALGGGELEVDRRHHLAGALAHPHVTGGEHPRVAPVAVEGAVLLVGGHHGQILQHLLALCLADAADVVLEALFAIPVAQVAAGDALHHLRDLA